MSAIEPRPEGLVKISGTIRNYKVTRASANFVFTDSDQTKLGVIAIAAGIAGLSGQAISTASSASAEEDADYVEFDLDGKPVKGWVWRSPFKEGDAVDVASEWQGEHYEAGGIARYTDRTISLYPHCSRGRSRHIRSAFIWGFIAANLFVGCLVLWLLATGSVDELNLGLHEGGYYVLFGVYIFFGIATISMARKWMAFVRLAEKVFRTLDLPNPSNIDLVKSSKAQRRPDDPGEYGTFYFRY